jgi:chromosome partitioning protein
MQCSFLAYDALLHLMTMVTQIKLQLHPPLLLLGLLMTMMDEHEPFLLSMQQKVSQHFQRVLFNQVIPRDSHLQGASGQWLIPVLQRPQSLVAEAYNKLAGEIMGRFALVARMAETAAGKS